MVQIYGNFFLIFITKYFYKPMANQFCVAKEEGLKKTEEFLSKNVYLSGQQTPGAEDATALESLTTAPCRKSYPNLFSWWWNLQGFSAEARNLWSGKACEEKKCDKKEDKKTCEQKKCDKKEEDEFDLFGEDNEEDKKAQEKLKVLAEYNKKNASKLAAQESRVVLEVKGFEVDQDFEALAKKIHQNITQEGLTWESGLKVKPLAFGMKFLEISCEIVDALVSIDDVIEKITETYPEEVQSVDIQSFDKK